MISLREFNKAYSDEVAVANLTFQVKPGQVMGLIGPNGAGKTTTLRALAGIIPPSDGHLSVNGFDVVTSPLDLKKITYYVPDDPQLFNDLTVEQHFEFTAGIYGATNWQTRMMHWLERFQLTEKLKTRAADLSRGMRQKLAISCAYICSPQALLLDEPMTGLDPLGIRVLKESISEHAERGSAIIISSHLLAMVEDICSHVLILEQGTRKFHGTLEDLKNQFGSQANQRLEDIFFEAVDSQNAESIDGKGAPASPGSVFPTVSTADSFSTQTSSQGG